MVFKTVGDSHIHSMNLLHKHKEKGSDLRQLQQSRHELINTKCDVSQALFRYHKLRRYVIEINCCICRTERQKQ